MPQGSEVQVSHKTSNKYFKHIHAKIDYRAFASSRRHYAADNRTARDIQHFGPFWQRWQQVIFCKSKSSHKSFPCKSKSSHKSFPCKSKSSHKSFGQTSSQVKSQVIWSKHKSSHKSLCPSTSQVAHYFFHSRHKKGNIIKSKRK